MSDVVTQTTKCTCGNILNAATGIDSHRAPEAGDISVCAYCGQLYRFADNTLQPITTTELTQSDIGSKQVETALRLRQFIQDSHPLDDIGATN